MGLHDLGKLANRFVSRAIGSEQKFATRKSPEEGSYVVISLYAQWEEFSRRLLYASAAKRPIAADGRIVQRAPQVRTMQDVDGQLRQMKNVRGNQRLVVHLGAPRQMVRACSYLSLHNEQVIVPAIVSQNSPADELRLVRNFLAHRNPDTAGQISNGPQKQTLEMQSLLSWLDEVQIGGRARFGIWAGDLSDVARATVQ